MNMTRRGLLALAGALPAQAKVDSQAGPLTKGPRHHFFGYYGICPWNQSGTHLVCLESTFQDHLPKPEESAGVMLADARTGALRKVTETRAWNFQQGSFLHWNPLQPDREILFNERKGDQIISVACDVATGKRRELPRAINGVSRGGRHAVCLTYGRLTRMRPVVGYVGARDPNPDSAHPDNDGVFVMDLATGEARLVVSIGEVYRRLVKRHPELREKHMWFNHTVFNKDDTRFFFLARCWKEEGGRKRLESAMFTCGVDGSALREVVPFGKGVSHFEWRNEREIMATFRTAGKDLDHVLFTDGKQDYRVIGAEFFEGDGHCSFAPDAEWMVTDGADDRSVAKKLLVYNIRTKESHRAGVFPMREEKFMSSDLRCDLHPRWDRVGRAICFDAIAADGTRQLHVARLKFS